MLSNRNRKFAGINAMTWVVGIALVAGGCDDKNAVHVYSAPKDFAPPQTAETATPPETTVAAAPVANTAGPQWLVPQGWNQLPAQQMRYATFAVDPADPKLNVVVYTFGPESGALLPNVNRWEQQIGAPVSDPADLGKVVTHFQNNGLEIDAVDIKGPPTPDNGEGSRMLAAIIPAGGQMWFLKFVGAESKVAKHKAEYDAFLKSISFAGATQTAAANPAAPAVAPAPADPHAGPSLIPAFRAYATPAGWALDPQEHAMRVATFHIVDGTQQADVIISMLPADMFGTPEANMNRWRGQVGLGPVTDAATVPRSKITVGGAEGFLIKLAGPDANAQQLQVAQVIKGTHAFFFKLIGPAKLVEQQGKSFEAFLQSIQFAVE